MAGSNAGHFLWVHIMMPSLDSKLCILLAKMIGV